MSKEVVESETNFEAGGLDRTLVRLSSYAAGLRYEDLPPETIHQAKRLWIDTLGCAIGASGVPTEQIARAAFGRTERGSGSPLIGGGVTSVEWATFINGILMRYLDFNDFYQAPQVKTGGHPTDTFAPTLAVASMEGTDGRSLIRGGVLGWEIYSRMSDAVESRVLDQGLYSSIASACVASNVLGLTSDGTANAIAIAAVANLSVLQSRFGTVSMWKSCAVPYACKNGVEAALLARAGMTGPPTAFEGSVGVYQLSSGHFELLGPFGGEGVAFQIHDSSIKHFPLGSLSQTAVECAIKIREQIQDLREVEQVNIETFADAVAIMGSEDKWRPRNRETADHSMPYGVAIALLHGTITPDHFSDEHLNHPDVVDMLGKIRINVSAEATALFPEQRRSTVEVVTRSGERYVEQQGFHRGHPANPMSDDEVESKFRSLAEARIGVASVNELLDRLWKLDEVTDLQHLVSLTALSNLR